MIKLHFRRNAIFPELLEARFPNGTLIYSERYQQIGVWEDGIRPLGNLVFREDFEELSAHREEYKLEVQKYKIKEML